MGLIALAIFIASLSVITISYTFGKLNLTADLLTTGLLNWGIIFLSFIYTQIMRRIVRDRLKSEKPIPEPLRYIGVAFEITLIAIILEIFVSASWVNSSARQIPDFIMPVFFLIIMLTTLRLNFKLCAFAGGLAAVEVWAIVLLNRDKFPLIDGPEFFGTLPIQLARPVLYLAVGLIAGFISNSLQSGFAKSLRAMEEQQKVIDVFGQHVSPSVVNKLLSQSDSLEQTEIRFVCVMFLDIRNFTTLSEKHTPLEVVNYLNQLFEFMIESVNRYNGIINKFLGDGFLAVFGAPLDDATCCDNGIRASFEILSELDRQCADGKIYPTKIGIGLHAGEVVTGNVGSSQRKEYTLIGDTVNVASRIEQLNKQFESQLLISDAVLESLKTQQVEAIPLEPLKVKGREQPVKIYRLS